MARLIQSMCSLPHIQVTHQGTAPTTTIQYQGAQTWEGPYLIEGGGAPCTMKLPLLTVLTVHIPTLLLHIPPRTTTGAMIIGVTKAHTVGSQTRPRKTHKTGTTTVVATTTGGENCFMTPVLFPSSE